MKHRVIGIDLGTTYSAVAAFDVASGEAQIIPDETNKATTPSVVGLDAQTAKAIVGRVAKQNLPNDPRNTIIEIKREMGEFFRPETAAKYGAEAGQVGKPVQVPFAGERFMPQEVSAFILMRMKEIAEREIGEEIRDAVITVPAYFTAIQRRATEQAALLAGLYPRQLIPEPTAAAICYGVDKFDPEPQVYMVYDLGGGTFDVSIISVTGGTTDVIATSGDPRLGGGDFDDVITQWVVELLQRDFQMDVSQDPVARARIKYYAEASKIDLSTMMETKMALLELRPTKPPAVTLTRPEFERRIEPLLNKSFTFVEAAINQAAKKGVKREQINAILLVGGSSNIPRVRSMLLDYFGKGEDFVRGDLNPDAVVARGAALVAYKYPPSPPPFDIGKRPDATLTNVEAADQAIEVGFITEHSLGVAVQGPTGEAVFDKLVDRGTVIPVSVTKKDYTNPGPVTDLVVRVYQGESAQLFENTLIGSLHLGPFEPREVGHHRFEVTFSLDRSGLLTVTVKHTNTGRDYEAKFEHETSVPMEGPTGLRVRRTRLLQMYLPGAQVGAAAATAQASAAGATAAATYTPPPPAAAAAPPASPPADAPPAAQAATPPSASAATPTAPTGAEPPAVIEPTRDVPEVMKSTVRRARKELLRRHNPGLLLALNALMTAVNEGRPEDVLNDLHDQLEDTYHDARQIP
jgi:molecular chaperone DnaK (HSP70)